MPLIHVRLVQDTYDRADKDALIANLTQGVVDIKGENVRPHVVVTLEEVRSGDWGAAGRPVTSEFVNAALSGQQA